MKYIITLLLALPLMVSAQNDQIALNAHLVKCQTDSLHLYKFMGINFQKVNSAPLNNLGKATFNLPKGERDFYYIGPSTSKIKPIIIGGEDSIEITGTCPNIRRAIVSNSPDNNTYTDLMKKINENSKEFGQVMKAIQSDARANRDQTETLKRLKALDDRKLELLNEYNNKDEFFGSIASLYSYQSYQNNSEGYKDELEYFSKNYFKYVDGKNPIYNKLPHVYEAYKTFVNMFIGVQMPSPNKIQILEDNLMKWDKQSAAFRFALGAIVNASRGKDNGVFVHFGQEFIKKYSISYPKELAPLRKTIMASKAMATGGEAPDIIMSDPTGKEIKLSDYRGKVVLIDFWASWCGPCRREIPNVRNMKDKYKDDGFEVFGVSLDRDKKRWINAIEKDGMDWPQVSDLKGWQSAAAQLYGIKSIPFTLLLDRDGKIIAKRLRGPQLEKKLSEIFGH